MKKLVQICIVVLFFTYYNAQSINLNDIYETLPDINNCSPGVLKQSEKDKILEYVNQIRALHGLSAVTWATEKDNASMQASLMCVANGNISHTPPSDWECYTTEGAEGCAKSNLHMGIFFGTDAPGSKAAIAGWMQDNNSANAKDKVGHRRAIMNPFLTKISVGRADGEPKSGGGGAIYEAMNLFYQDFTNGDISSSDIDFVAYPYGNYPTELVDPSFYLNFSPIYNKQNLWGNTNIDYSQAVITMKDDKGNNVPVDSKSWDNEGWGSIPTNMVWKVTGGFKLNTKYTVEITNVIVNGESKDYSYWFNVTDDTNTEKPAAPVLTTPTNNSVDIAQNITLKWNQSATATSYHVQVAENQDFTNNTYDETGVAINQFATSGLKNKTKYYWRVSASNSVGEGDWSATWNFTTLDKSTAIPTLALPENNASNLEPPVNFVWNKINTASTYFIQVSPNEDFDLNKLVILRSNLIDNSYTSTGTELSNGKTYYWRVAATINGELGDWSDVWQFSTKSNSPGPTETYPADSMINISLTPKIEWESINGATSYDFILASGYSFNPAVTIFEETGLTDNYFNVPANNLELNTMYFWKVKAYLDGGAETDWSPIYAFTTTTNDGIFEIASFDATMELAPMPANSLIRLSSQYINAGSCELKIFDLNGNVVLNQNITAELHNITVDISSLINGTYFIMIDTGSKQLGSVFIKN